MQHETVSTPPSQGGVFCPPPLARAGARFNTVPIQVQRVLNGDIKISSLDRARTREIEAAVNDAVAAFGSPRDFRIWAWYAHRIGLAYLHNRHWSRTGLAKSSFYYALKKVKKNFHADKHWAKLHSTRKKRIRGLD